MHHSRDNHYVAEWYQKGFLFKDTDPLHYLDLTPEKLALPNGKRISINELKWRSPSQCFYQTDLYTTFFGNYINDEIERKLFGKIDDIGARAVRAFTGDDISEWHNHFTNFFSYIDTQKIRTPKGLQWIKEHYPNLGQLDLMVEMQALMNMHCTIWTEGVREIVSAKNSETKFIVTDHPVTIYNKAYPSECDQCAYPNDPSIALKGSQTIYALDMDHCLILTNYEYAKEPDNQNPCEKRTHARNFKNSLVRTDTFIKSRFLSEEEVRKINYVLKKRAHKYIAAAKKEWLFPEQFIQTNWEEIAQILLPPPRDLWHFGGETYVAYNDGSTYYQDAFGRTQPENPYLKKPKRNKEPSINEPCGCGGAKKYKKCCKDKAPSERPSWDEWSIRERNIAFANGINDILGFSRKKTWEDVRRELSNEQVKKIHELYGFLWPLETDIFSLLPKPDRTLRASYTGIIDPRTIGNFATSSALYFDEVIIQSPFMNPWSVALKYNPTQSPHQHKLQTLKNVALFLTLMPFVEAGYINLIPDPCSFDGYLRQQMFSMAQERTRGHSIEAKDKEVMEHLHKDDFDRTVWMLSEKQQRHQLKKILPDLPEDKIAEMLKYIEIKKAADPFSLLQNDVYDSDQGGQLQMSMMAPNFEIALFLAQATGAFLLTDSQYRWQEMVNAQSKTDGIITYNWKRLSNLICKQEYVLNSNPWEVFQLRGSGKLGQLRKALGDIYREIAADNAPSNDLVERLEHQLAKALQASSREIKSNSQTNFKGKFDCLIPKGGIVHNNVQRMLLGSGMQTYLKSVPMAIYLELLELH